MVVWSVSNRSSSWPAPKVRPADARPPPGGRADRAPAAAARRWRLSRDATPVILLGMMARPWRPGILVARSSSDSWTRTRTKEFNRAFISYRWHRAIRLAGGGHRCIRRGRGIPVAEEATAKPPCCSDVGNLQSSHGLKVQLTALGLRGMENRSGEAGQWRAWPLPPVRRAGSVSGRAAIPAGRLRSRSPSSGEERARRR